MPASSMGCGLEPGDLLGDEDALLEAAVRELQAGDDVADGEDAVDVGAAALVGLHEAAVHLDADLLVAEAVGGRAATDGDEQQVGLDDGAALDGDLHAGVGRSRRDSNGVPVWKAILRLRKARSSTLDDGLVLGGDQPGERLDDGDLGAERPPHAGELAADDAAAEDDHGGGDRARA